MSNLFQLGSFTLNSGKTSEWKLECDALTDADWEALAKMVFLQVNLPFGTVEGVPRGGLKLAAALEKYKTPEGPYHLIVDDVLTTGGSMERLRKELRQGIERPHSFDSSWTCDYCGIAEERVRGDPETAPCPKRSEKPREDWWNIIGAVVFARGPCPSWIAPLFQMRKELWV